MAATTDISVVELDKISRRRAIRSELKSEFNRKFYNPYRQIYRIEMHDPAVERFMAARASRFEFTKPTWKTFLAYAAVVVIPFYTFSKLVINQKLAEERLYRGGMIPYEDQHSKNLRVPCNGYEML